MINSYESKEFIYTNGSLVLQLNCNFPLVTNTYRRVQEKHGQRFFLFHLSACEPYETSIVTFLGPGLRRGTLFFERTITIMKRKTDKGSYQHLLGSTIESADVGNAATCLSTLNPPTQLSYLPGHLLDW